MRSGFVSILGRPNAGKSTLVNALVGEKVAIVTSKPQTTRNRIHGVLEVAAKGKLPAAQIVFVDTPGVHKPGTHLDRQMMQEVHAALEDRDAVMLVVDASREVRLEEEAAAAPLAEGEVAPEKPQHRKLDWRSEDEFVFGLVEKLDCPVFLVINKIDLVRREELLPLIERLRNRRGFAGVFPISARKRDGLDALVDELVAALPEGERYFPKDQFTDQPERFLVAELIRERILMETGEEVPYASAVVVETFEEPAPVPVSKAKKPRMLKGGIPAPERLPVTHIGAVIYCERDGQKAILIGRAGEKLKVIGAGARREIEGLLGTRVYLELRVIVEPDWRERKGFVDGLDWRKQLEELGTKQGREEEK